MSVSVTEATRQRLAISKAVFGPPKANLSILDQLAVPRTFDDLVMQIQAKDCSMFFPMRGMPRAFMEIPAWEGKYRADGLGGQEPDFAVERWIYRVLGWWARGSRSQTESLLCEAAWKDLVELRKTYGLLFGDMDPIIVWRREPEIEEHPALNPGPCFEHNKAKCRKCSAGSPRTSINMRFAIPGLQLDRHSRCLDNPVDRVTDRFDPRFEVKPEPAV